jgi:hypothetical protein
MLHKLRLTALLVLRLNTPKTHQERLNELAIYYCNCIYLLGDEISLVKLDRLGTGPQTFCKGVIVPNKLNSGIWNTYHTHLGFQLEFGRPVHISQR